MTAEVPMKIHPMLRARMEAKTADLQAEYAQLQEEDRKGRGVDEDETSETGDSRNTIWIQAAAAAKTYRKKLAHLMQLANKHAPELHPQIMDSGKDFLANEIRKAPSELQVRIWRIFDMERAIGYYSPSKCWARSAYASHRPISGAQAQGRSFRTARSSPRCWPPARSSPSRWPSLTLPPPCRSVPPPPARRRQRTGSL